MNDQQRQLIALVNTALPGDDLIVGPVWYDVIRSLRGMVLDCTPAALAAYVLRVDDETMELARPVFYLTRGGLRNGYVSKGGRYYKGLGQRLSRCESFTVWGDA